VAQQQLLSEATGLTWTALIRVDALPEMGTTLDVIGKRVGVSNHNSFSMYVNYQSELLANMDLAADSGSGALVTPMAFATGEFAHVAGVWTGQGGELRVFQRGAFSASKNNVTAEFDNSPILIGADQNATLNDIFDGVIDEVRIYTRALSDLEIEELAGCID
jgi:hypothetical protein